MALSGWKLRQQKNEKILAEHQRAKSTLVNANHQRKTNRLARNANERYENMINSVQNAQDKIFDSIESKGDLPVDALGKGYAAILSHGNYGSQNRVSHEVYALHHDGGCMATAAKHGPPSSNLGLLHFNQTDKSTNANSMKTMAKDGMRAARRGQSNNIHATVTKMNSNWTQ